MSESNAKQTESNRRPASSILAPSRLAFGISAGSERTSAASNPFATKVAFAGLKASKLSSVAEAVCTSLKPEEEPEKTESTPAAAKPSFIPLAKENSNNGASESVSLSSSINSTKEDTKKPASDKDGAKFVFGQNLNDRAANYTPSKNGSDEAHESPELSELKPQAEADSVETETSSTDKQKTLSESAAEYCETRNKKKDFGEVELITGEESETNVFQMGAKLYMFDKRSWIERGRGQLRLNDQRPEKETEASTSRIIMRTAGSLRVILNSKIFPEMTVEKPDDKKIRLTATDGLDQGMKVFLVSGTQKDIGTLFVALTRRLEAVKKSNPGSKLAKRKLSEEEESAAAASTPPPEKEAKVVQ